LESYHPYLLPQEVSKTPTTLGTYSSLLKIRKGRIGFLRPLGVNAWLSPSRLVVHPAQLAMPSISKEKNN
jgi:hypothetical protein